jgi:hypothetical protein
MFTTVTVSEVQALVEGQKRAALLGTVPVFSELCRNPTLFSPQC